MRLALLYPDRLSWRPMLVGCLLGASTSLAVAAPDGPLRWRWSNPRPHGNNVVDMSYSSALGIAVQVTERGQIYASSDFGLWIPRESGTSLALRSVAFFGASSPRILVTGENGTVLYADDIQAFQAGTLLDGPTSDWLEAVAVSSSLAVAVGDNGAIYTSPDGAEWKRQSPAPAIVEWLRGVAFGNGTFVLAGDNGFLARSTDGTNWTQVPLGIATHLNRVHYQPNLFTVVGEEGVSYTSSNAGVSWQPDHSGATNALFEAGHGNATRLLLGAEEVRLESSGVWQDQLGLPVPPPTWTYYSAIGLTDYYLLAGRTGLMVEGFKTNGTSFFWTPADHSVRHWLFDAFYATNVYVAVGDRATVMTSGNGIDWNLELVPNAVTNSIFLGVGGSTNLLVAAGNAGSLIISPNTLTEITETNQSGMVTNYTVSSLGVVWHPIEPRPATYDLQGVAFGSGLYVVTGDNGWILTSPDGTNWTRCLSGTVKLLSGVTAWPGGFVACGDDGILRRSADGLNWSPVASGTLNWIYKVRFLNDVLVAVGQNGTLLTSTNAVNWIPQVSGTTAWLNDATFIEDTWFVVGTQGTVLSSTNAVDWVSRGSITLKSFYAAATDGGQLIAAGIEGVILRSPVVPDLTPIHILDFAHITSTNAPSQLQNLFLFGGKPDQQFTLDRTSSLGISPWSAGTLLEFLDSSATLFYLESSSTSSAPAREFYEATLLIEP